MSLIYIRSFKETVMKYDWCFLHDIFVKSVYDIFTYMKGVLILVKFIYNFPFSFKIMIFPQYTALFHVFLMFNGDIFSYVVSHIDIVKFGTVELKDIWNDK